MIPPRLVLLAILLLAFLILTQTAASAAEPKVAETASPSKTSPRLELRDGDRIVLLGGTFVERMQTFGYLETVLTSRLADREITFRNLGWSGDTVQGISRAVFGTPDDGFERLKKDVLQVDPTLVLVNYGANEAHAGPAGLETFGHRLNKLLEFLESTGARIAIVSPHRYANVGPPLPNPAAYNKNLTLYCRMLQETAARRGHAYIDLLDLLELARAAPHKNHVASENGIHFTEYGYWRAAPFVADRWNAPAARGWRININVETLGYDAADATMKQIERTAGGIRFSAAARWLGLHAPPERFAARPLAAVQSGEVRIRGLAPGNYRFEVDGGPIFWASAENFARGLAVPIDVDDEQVEKLRQTIVDKNELFFHRYRPQNETYLFLFRKHEQGNNAVEIPQFDPLIAEKEEQIERLKRPAAHVYELVRDDS